MKREDEQEQDAFAAIVEAIDAMEVEPDRHLSIQIDRSLRDAIRAAQNSGQGASVTITIAAKVRPDDPRRVLFSAKVAAKLPRPPVSMVSLYADDAGAVHRSDPAQQPLPFPTPDKILFSRKD